MRLQHGHRPENRPYKAQNARNRRQIQLRFHHVNNHASAAVPTVVVQTFLKDAVQAIGEGEPQRPLVFFIDELDRCRPSFAIELLERVKHLFDVKNIVFVLSIDKKQLEAITAAVYGERIDALEYLRRFIDLDFYLPLPHTKDYTK